MTVDDKIVMVPANADVTNVIWYNVDVFAELGLSAAGDVGRVRRPVPDDRRRRNDPDRRSGTSTSGRAGTSPATSCRGSSAPRHTT